MRYFVPALLLVLSLTSAGWAQLQAIPQPWTPRLMIDASGTLIGPDNPLPVVGSFSVNMASATINADQSPFVDCGLQQITAGPVSQLILAAADRRFIQVVNLATDPAIIVWVCPASSTATPGSGFPVYGGSDWSDSLGDSVPVAVITEGASVPLTVFQGK